MPRLLLKARAEKNLGCTLSSLISCIGQSKKHQVLCVSDQAKLLCMNYPDL
jgi:hypothetical protein